MLLKIQKLLSSLDKNYWHLKYSNEFFREIIKKIMEKTDFEHIEIFCWTKEISLFSWIEYEKAKENNKFTTLKMDKENSIRFIYSDIFHKLRLFEFNIFSKGSKVFNITSDNYGEHTTIKISKFIEENSLLKILDNINKFD